MPRLKTLPPLRPIARPAHALVPASREKSRRQHKPWRRWYNTTAWQQLRIKILSRDGWVCQQTGVSLVGEKHAENSAVIDHIVPHNGDRALFWDPSNLQAVSKAYHDRQKQRLEQLTLGGRGG